MVTIVDADGHIVEPQAVWDQYTEPEFRDRVIQVRRNSQGVDEFWINGEIRGSGGVAASIIPGGFLDVERALTANWDDILPGSWDPHERIKVMDAERIDLAVLYPSLWLLYGDLTDPNVAVAACRAYNNWLGDFCRAYPRRIFGVAPMPIVDVGEAIKEMRRVADLNLKGIMIRPNPFNGRSLKDPAYEPFWREAQELDLPVSIHSSFGTRMPTLGGDRYPHDIFSFHMVCHPFEQQAACMDMICGGVLERYPRLRVGFLECGVGWVGYWLDRMDSHFEKMGRMVPWLKKRPSEYFMEQCYVSFDPDERTLSAMCDLGFDRNILWGSDFPHFDCTYPGAVAQVEGALSTLKESARTNILRENAIRFYQLDA